MEPIWTGFAVVEIGVGGEVTLKLSPRRMVPAQSLNAWQTRDRRGMLNAASRAETAKLSGTAEAESVAGFDRVIVGLEWGGRSYTMRQRGRRMG